MREILSILSSVPVADPLHRKERIILKGDILNSKNTPSGCAIHTRCPVATALCKESRPVMKALKKEHQVACHLVKGDVINENRLINI